MGWNLSTIRNFFNPKSYYAPYYNELGNEQVRYIDMDNLHEVYHKIPHVKTVINQKALMMSNGIFKVVKDGEEVENHAITELLQKPNFMQTGKEFVQNLSINKSIFGNSFVYNNRGAFKNTKALWVLPSSEIKVETTGKMFKQTEIEGVIKSITVNEEEFPIDEIIRFKEEDNNLILAESKLNTLKQQISNIKYSYDSRNILLNERGGIGLMSLDNSAGKDGMLVNPMSPKEKEKVEEKLVKNYGIQHGQRRVIVTSSPTKWTPMTFPTKDLMLFEEVADDFSVIIDAYGMNEELFSKVKGSTFDNVDAAEKRTYQDTIIPEAELIAYHLGQGMGLPDNERLILDYSHLPILQEDEKYKAEVESIRIDSIEKALSLELISEEDAKLLYENY